MLTNDFEALKAAGCIQCEYTDMRQMSHALMDATSRNPCMLCPAFDYGRCNAYRLHNTDATLQRAEDEKRKKAKERAKTPHNGTGKWAGMTIRQIAKAEEISLKEARRRKAKGEYNS